MAGGATVAPKTKPKQSLGDLRRRREQVQTKQKVRTSNKDINKILDALDKTGLTKMSLTSKQRVKIEVEGKPPVFVSQTPSGSFVVHAVRRDIKRILGIDLK